MLEVRQSVSFGYLVTITGSALRQLHRRRQSKPHQVLQTCLFILLPRLVSASHPVLVLAPISSEPYHFFSHQAIIQGTAILSSPDRPKAPDHFHDEYRTPTNPRPPYPPSSPCPNSKTSSTGYKGYVDGCTRRSERPWMEDRSNAMQEGRFI